MRRLLSSLALLIGLTLAAAGPALAQAPNPNGADLVPPPAEEESKGEPLYGYVGTAFLCAAAIFAICKSARR